MDTGLIIFKCIFIHYSTLVFSSICFVRIQINSNRRTLFLVKIKVYISCISNIQNKNKDLSIKTKWEKKIITKVDPWRRLSVFRKLTRREDNGFYDLFKPVLLPLPDLPPRSCKSMSHRKGEEKVAAAWKYNWVSEGGTTEGFQNFNWGAEWVNIFFINFIFNN